MIQFSIGSNSKEEGKKTELEMTIDYTTLVISKDFLISSKNYCIQFYCGNKNV